MLKDLIHLGPIVFTTDIGYPTRQQAPNLYEGAIADPEETTHKACRRRLLSWAELLESEMVHSHWDYGDWGEGTERMPMKACEESLCGTVACAGGWLFMTPEARNYGFEPMFFTNRPSGRTDGSYHTADYFGITDNDVDYITLAGPPPDGCPRLNLRGNPPSSAKDVAKAIRTLADLRHPEGAKEL